MAENNEIPKDADKILFAENNEIPEDADKILFAENFISFMMFRMNQVIYPCLRSTPFRNVVYQAFNESVQRAVTFLDRTMEVHHDVLFSSMENSNAVNEENYIKFAEDLAKKYFPDGFDANNFLHYGVHLSNLAVYFYNHGVREALNLAFKHIYNAVREYDMATGSWETLHRIAERYASMAQDSINMESPKTSSDEEVPGNPDENAAENQGNVLSAKVESDDNLPEINQSDLASNNASPLKRPLSEKGTTYVPDKLGKYKLESRDISGGSQKYQSTSGMFEAKKFNDPSCSIDSELKDEIDSRTSKIKYPTQSSSSNAQNILELGKKNSSKDQDKKMSADKETSQALNAKPTILHFERHSPSSSDDENRSLNKDTDPSLS